MSNLTKLEQNRLDNGREYRSVTMKADSDMTVTGYAATFNQPYLLVDYGTERVYEQVDPSAFNGCDMNDVVFQYNHQGRVMARTKNGTLQLYADQYGLRVVAQLGGTDLGRQTYEEIKGGYTDKMSFGFLVGTDTYSEERDQSGILIITRTITKFKKLYDVSTVSIPANDMTSISARTLADGAIEAAAAERLRRERQRNKIKIMLEVNK